MGGSLSTRWTNWPERGWGLALLSPSRVTADRNGLSVIAPAVGVAAAPAPVVNGSARKTMPEAEATNARRYRTTPLIASMNARQLVGP
jgi:hypothetical protein